MLDEVGGTTDVLQTGESDLGNDGTELARGSADTVGGGAVSGREDLTRDDEGRGVGSEVLEEVGETVENDEGGDGVLGKGVVGESEDDEEDGQHGEAHELDGLSADPVDEDEACPVSRDETGDGQDDVTDTDVSEGGVDDQLGSSGGDGTESNVLEDDGRAERGGKINIESNETYLSRE